MLGAMINYDSMAMIFYDDRLAMTSWRCPPSVNDRLSAAMTLWNALLAMIN